jgi:GNAT superfamily N-acetyltransferase
MTDATHQVRRAVPAQAAHLADVLAAAFAEDPFNAWLLPDRRSRVARLQRGFKAMLSEMYLPHGECYLSGAGDAAAVWAKPGAWHVPGKVQLRMLPGLARTFGHRLPRALNGFEQLDKHHPEIPPHWFLALIGVRPESQGKGIGTDIVAPILETCDATGTPAYLETSNARNLAFYHRLGFVIRDQFELTRGPHIWTMWREPGEP